MLARRELSEGVTGAVSLIDPSAILGFTGLPFPELNVAGALLKLSAFVGDGGRSRSRVAI